MRQDTGKQMGQRQLVTIQVTPLHKGVATSSSGGGGGGGGGNDLALSGTTIVKIQAHPSETQGCYHHLWLQSSTPVAKGCGKKILPPLVAQHITLGTGGWTDARTIIFENRTLYDPLESPQWLHLARHGMALQPNDPQVSVHTLHCSVSIWWQKAQPCVQPYVLVKT